MSSVSAENEVFSAFRNLPHHTKPTANSTSWCSWMVDRPYRSINPPSMSELSLTITWIAAMVPSSPFLEAILGNVNAADLRELKAALAVFADERDWTQFHAPRN